MRRIVVLAAVLGLVSGLLGAFAFSALSDEASAALFAFVRETNVDANGHIRVHEQGTANVAGTVDVGNLPAVQDVNVVSMPSQAGRLVNLSLTPTIPGGDDYRSQMVDVADCSRITLLVHGGTPVDNYHYASADGTTTVLARLEGTVAEGLVDGIRTGSLQSEVVTLPFLQAKVSSGAAGAPTPTAWIWCVP